MKIEDHSVKIEDHQDRRFAKIESRNARQGTRIKGQELGKSGSREVGSRKSEIWRSGDQEIAESGSQEVGVQEKRRSTKL